MDMDSPGQYYRHQRFSYHCFQFHCQLHSRKALLILETGWHQPRLLTSQMSGISPSNLFVQDLENEY